MLVKFLSFLYPCSCLSGVEGLTSIKKRLDHLLSQLSIMGIELDEEASGNAVAQLAIITGAFKESSQFPVCCFSYDNQARIRCDSNGPLGREEFMEKCAKCQAQIKAAIQNLKSI